MATDSEKNLPLDKEKEKEKRENQKKSLKAAAAKKPKRSIVKFFKDAKAEFKKVTWPTPRQVLNNTGVVVAAIVITGGVIFGFDTVLAKILEFVYKR
ncbi:MAG: preprotein translocase subunit SecE [Oscillospiraceae bacterium]|nr:preprotein translocase subunit SecE [Oscillospiraceae bacterium]